MSYYKSNTFQDDNALDDAHLYISSLQYCQELIRLGFPDHYKQYQHYIITDPYVLDKTEGFTLYEKCKKITKK